MSINSCQSLYVCVCAFACVEGHMLSQPQRAVGRESLQRLRNAHTLAGHSNVHSQTLIKTWARCFSIPHLGKLSQAATVGAAGKSSRTLVVFWSGRPQNYLRHSLLSSHTQQRRYILMYAYMYMRDWMVKRHYSYRLVLLQRRITVLGGGM